MWALVLFVLVVFTQSNAQTDSPKIVIVGAGLAGYSAAAKLMENGFNDIMILEAEDRVGGRVNSVPFGVGFIDLGAQWCHGEKDNAVYEMVHEHFEFGDLGLNESTQTYFLSNGGSVDQGQCAKLYSLLQTKFAVAEESVNGSIGQIVEDEYSKALNLLPEEERFDKDLADQMLLLFHQQMNSFYASESWFDVSALYNQYSEECEGNSQLTWKTEGFRTVLDFITKKRPDPSKFLDVGSKIQLRKEVTNIKWNPSGSSEKVTVKCADGSSYSADHVIFTASLGVLKDRYETLFVPKLPAPKIKAIENLGFGTFGKVFLEFEEPFWSSGTISFTLLWTAEDLEAIKETDREWMQDLSTFITVDGFPNVLEGAIAGKNMRLFETLSNETLISDCMWLLEKFLAKPLPRPINMKRTRWLTNKNFVGSYSYFTMDSEKMEVTPKLLAQSLLDVANKPVILFAGEATDERFSGYTHGAISSGRRAGNELLSFYEKGDQH